MTSSPPTAPAGPSLDQSSPPGPTYTQIYDQLLREWPQLIERSRQSTGTDPSDPLVATQSDDPMVGDE